MSETDDTDDLLLIPPDLFSHESEILETYASGAYFDIVDSLISHVGILEDRINYIESTENITLVSNSLDCTIDNMDTVRKCNSSDNLLKSNPEINSVFSTPQKPRSRFRMNSLPSTPSTNLSPYKQSYRSNFQSSPQDYSQANKGKIHMLKEIDNFVNNVENVQVNASRKLNYNTDTSSEINSLNMNEVQSMLEVIEMQRKSTEARLRAKEKEIILNQRPVHEVMFKDEIWHPGTNDNSIPDYGYRMKEKFIKTHNLDNHKFEKTQKMYGGALKKLTVSKLESDPISDISHTDSILADKSESISSSDSTQTTARRKTDIRNTDMLHNTVPQHQLHNSTNLQMLSLNDLWGNQNVNRENSFLQKLQEEKMRRQHCEQLIYELQSKTLELHEKLAVAVQVDETKDNAIHKFYSAWENVSSQMEVLQKEKDNLEQEIGDIRHKTAAGMAETLKKINYYENEASKALNLAHGNQEKLINYEKQSTEYSNKVLTFESQLKDTDKKYKEEMERNKQLTEIVAEKEIELNNGKSVLQAARKEIAESKKAVEICQAEFATMKAQYTQLELLLNDKQDIIKGLESQKRALTYDNENLKLLQKQSEENVNKVKETAEKTKTELRNFYQQQVEVVVRDKLKEFQLQLDKAESSLHDEIKSRELSIARTAAGHIQQLSEKHTLEVNLLEEKHIEEIRLYQLQLSQLYQQINDLNSKLKQQNERRTNIAEELHKVMEAQWMEAMKIINYGKSPIIRQDPNITLDQLNSLKTKSYSNVEEVLSVNLSDDSDKKYHSETVMQNVPGPSTLNHNLKSQFTYRVDETPKLYRGRREISNDLQKYVQMLLNNPENSMNGEIGNGDKLDNPTNDKSNVPTNYLEDPKNKSCAHSRRHGKPPWK